MVVVHLLLHKPLSAVHRNGSILAGEAVAEALHEERLVQDVCAVVHLLGNVGVDLLFHLLTNLDTSQASLLLLICFSESCLLKALQEVGNISCVNAQALSQIALQTIGIGTTEMVAEGVDTNRIDHLNGLL